MKSAIIRNGTLIDGTGANPIPAAGVVFENGTIQYAGIESKNTQKPEKKLEEIDAGGGYILPGFIDTHVHLAMQDYNLQALLTTPFSYNFYKIPGYMRATLDAGITSVRDASGIDLGMKKAVDDGLIIGPRMQISVNALSITGGHGDNWMPSGIDLNPFSAYPGFPDGRCDGVEEVRRKVREILRAGAEVIKICSTGGVMSPTDRPEYTQFSPDELKVIVEEAAYHGGVKVMSHAQGLEGIRQAVLAGIHSIEHGIFLDDEVIRLMKEKGTYLVPTLLAPVSIVENEEMRKTLPEMMVKKAEEVMEIHRTSIGKAYRAGVRIAMGTDAGVMHHGTNLRELGLMQGIGLSPMEAILATTKVAAECMGWDKKVGTVEKGKWADIVICKENPLENLRSLEDTANILVVFKGGEIVKDLR